MNTIQGDAIRLLEHIHEPGVRGAVVDSAIRVLRRDAAEIARLRTVIHLLEQL